MAGPVDKKLVRWESQERVDVPDVSQVVRSVVDYHESIVGSLFSHAAVVSDWKVSKNSGTTIKVERLAGGALISPEIGGTDSIHGEGQTGYSVLLDTGSTSKVYDISAHAANAHHTVWVETKFVASTNDTRVKWSHASSSEYLDSFNTRYELTWNIHVLGSEQPPTYTSWVRVGTVFWDGNIVDDAKIYQSGQMLFEGLVHGADPTDGTSGHLVSTEAITALNYKTYPLPDFTRSTNRWTYGAKDMGMFCHMVLKKIEELQDATGLTPWWDKPLNSLNNLFAGGVTIGTGQDGNKGKYNGTAVTVGGATYYDITTALQNAATFCGLSGQAPTGDSAAHIHILPGRYVVTSRVTLYAHKNIVFTGSGRDSTHIYTMSAAITGAAATSSQGIYVAHPSTGYMQSFEMKDIKWVSDNTNGGGAKAPVTYSLRYINPGSTLAPPPPPASPGQARFKFQNIMHHPGTTPENTVMFLDHDDSIVSTLTVGVNTQWEFINCSLTHYGGVLLSSATDVRMVDCNPIGSCYIGVNDAAVAASHYTYVSKVHITGCHEGSVFAAGERKQVFVDGCQLSNLSISAGEETVVRGCNFRHVNGQSKTRSGTGTSVDATSRLLIDTYTATGNPDAHIKIESCKFQPAGLSSTVSVVSKYSECRILDCFFGTSKGEADATPDTKNIVIGEVDAITGAVTRTPTSVLGCTFRNSGATIFESVDTIRDCIVHMENNFCQAAFVKNTAHNHAVNGSNHVDRTVLGVTTIKGLDAVFMYDRAKTLFENVVSLEDAKIRVSQICNGATVESGQWEIRFTDHAPIPYGLGSTGQGDGSSSGIPTFVMSTGSDLNHDDIIQMHWRSVSVELMASTLLIPMEFNILNAAAAFDIKFKDVDIRCEFDHTMHGGKQMRAMNFDAEAPSRGKMFFDGFKTPLMVGITLDTAAKSNDFSLSIKDSYIGSLATSANFYNVEINSSTIDYGLELQKESSGSVSGNFRDGLGICKVSNCRIGHMTGDGIFNERVAQAAGFTKSRSGPAGILNEDVWPSAQADVKNGAYYLVSSHVLGTSRYIRPRVTIGTYTQSTVSQGNINLYQSYEVVELTNNNIRAIEIHLSGWRDCNVNANTIRMWPDVQATDYDGSFLMGATTTWKHAAACIEIDSEKIRLHDNDVEIRHGTAVLEALLSEYDYVRLAYNCTECSERPISWSVIGNKVSQAWGAQNSGYLAGASKTKSSDGSAHSSTDIKSEGAAVFKFYVHPDHQAPVQYRVALNTIVADLRKRSNAGNLTYHAPYAYKQVGLTYAASNLITTGGATASSQYALYQQSLHPNAAGVISTLTDNIFVRAAPEANWTPAENAGEHFNYAHWEPMASLWAANDTDSDMYKYRSMAGNNLTKAFAIAKTT